MTAIRVIDQHQELEGVGITTHDQIDGALTGSTYIILSGTAGSGPLSASRTLSAGSGIVLVDGGPGGALTISSTASGSGGRLRDYNFSLTRRVPNTGIQYLKSGEVYTSDAPLIFSKDVTLNGGSIRTNIVDASKDYTVVFQASSSLGLSTVGTILLPSGSNNQTGSFSAIVSASFGIEVFLSRSAGTGRSDFSEINVTLEGDEQ